MPVNDGAPRWVQMFRNDRTGLAMLGVLSLLRGVSYLPFFADPDRSPAHFFEVVIPVDVWAWVWIGIGALCLLGAVTRRLIPLGFGVGVGVHAAWATSFIAATFTGESGRGWVSALGYFSAAFFVLWALSRGRKEEIAVTVDRR